MTAPKTTPEQLKLPGLSEPVALASVSYLQASGQYTWVHFADTPPYLVSLNIARVLPPDSPGFTRLSGGLLVRLSIITRLSIQIESYECGRSYENLTLTLQNGQTLSATRRVKESCLNALFSLNVPVVFHVKTSLVISLKRLRSILGRLTQTHKVEFTVKNNAIRQLTFYPHDYKINGPNPRQPKRQRRNTSRKRPATAKPTA